MSKINELKEALQRLIKSLSVEGNILDLYNKYDAIKICHDIIRLIKPDTFTYFDLYHLIDSITVTALNGSTRQNNESIINILSNSDIESICDKILLHVKNAPHEYYVLFPVKSCVPFMPVNIKISDSISTVCDYTGSKLKAGNIGLMGFNNIRNTFIRINSNGFYLKDTSSPVIENAISAYKQFVFLCISFDILTINRINKKDFDYVIIGNEQSEEKINLQIDAIEYSNYLEPSNSFVGNILEHSDPEKYVQTRLENFSYIIDKSIDEQTSESILAASEWGFDAMTNDNNTFSFIQSTIALECLMGEKEDKHSIRNIGDRIAYLLGNSRTQRDKYKNMFNEVYSLRSNLVHGKKQRLKESEAVIYYQAMELLKWLINAEISRLMRCKSS